MAKPLTKSQSYEKNQIMKELSIEQMEGVSGGMSVDCGIAIAALGFGTIAIGALTGGIGFFGAITLMELGLSSVAFMRTCGPSDFK